MNILVLGGTGLIGSIMCKALNKHGHQTLSVGTTTYKKFIIGQEVDIDLFENMNAVIYLSWMFDSTKSNYHEINVQSLKKVLEICKSKNLELFFISTLLASPQAASTYNRTKGYCEELVLKHEQKIIRFGSVFISTVPYGGFYGKIYKFYKTFKFLPKIMPDKKIFFKTELHNIETLCKDLFNYKNKIITCTNNKAVSFFEVIFNNKKIFYIPIKWELIYRILKLLEFMNLNFGFRSDSILSIWGENNQTQ